MTAPVEPGVGSDAWGRIAGTSSSYRATGRTRSAAGCGLTVAIEAVNSRLFFLALISPVLKFTGWSAWRWAFLVAWGAVLMLAVINWILVLVMRWRGMTSSFVVLPACRPDELYGRTRRRWEATHRPAHREPSDRSN